MKVAGSRGALIRGRKGPAATDNAPAAALPVDPSADPTSASVGSLDDSCSSR